MSDKRIATFTVTVELDPEAYASEYGELVVGDTALQGALHALSMLQSRLESFTLAGVTLPGFKDSHGHWASLEFGILTVLPVHRDALATGQRNPYDAETGEFIAKCVCGREFRDVMSPDGAELLLSDHCETENSK